MLRQTEAQYPEQVAELRRSARDVQADEGVLVPQRDRQTNGAQDQEDARELQSFGRAEDVNLNSEQYCHRYQSTQYFFNRASTGKYRIF